MGAIFLIVFEHSFTMIGRIIVANKFVGYLNIRIKNKHTCVHGLILGGKTRRRDNLTTFSFTYGCRVVFGCFFSAFSCFDSFFLGFVFFGISFPSMGFFDLRFGLGVIIFDFFPVRGLMEM